MKITKQSHEILTARALIREIPTMIELAGRTCYKSEKNITNTSSEKFCRMLIKLGHEAMIEHGSISVRFITDRGVSHELVRHRIASFAQESTRYVKYDKNMEFIRPVFSWSVNDLQQGDNRKFILWKSAMLCSSDIYKDMIKLGCKPQEARSVLPNSLKTEIVVTANIREWRTIFKLRCDKAAHPQIRSLMIPLLKELVEGVPCLFEDILEGIDE